MPAKASQQYYRAHLLMLFVVFVWGSTFVLVKNALGDISPLLFNLLRMLLATVCLAVVYRGHLRHITRRAWMSGAIVGACLASGYQFQTAGLALTTPSKSAFLTGLVVVFVPLLSAIPWLRSSGVRAAGWSVWISAPLAFAGIVLLTTPSIPGRAFYFYDFGAVNVGDILSLFCAVGFSFHVMALARASALKIPFQQLAILQIAFCTIFMAISTPLLEKPWVHFTPRLLFAVGLAAILATAAAFTIQSWAQQFLPATHTALILTMEPVFAWITAFIILHESLGHRGTLGAMLILCGIGLTELIPARIQPTAHEGVPVKEENVL